MLQMHKNNNTAPDFYNNKQSKSTNYNLVKNWFTSLDKGLTMF